MYDVKNMYSFMKNNNYLYTKDALGFYFDKGNIKFSIMKQANWYNCFYNEREGYGWKLMNKSGVFDNFPSALAWVVTESQKIKS